MRSSDRSAEARTSDPRLDQAQLSSLDPGFAIEGSASQPDPINVGPRPPGATSTDRPRTRRPASKPSVRPAVTKRPTKEPAAAKKRAATKTVRKNRKAR